MSFSNTKVVLASQTNSGEIPRPNDKAAIGSLQFISGTGTIAVEGSMDGGTTWGAIELRKSDGTSAASVSAAGIYKFDPGAVPRIRINCTAFTAQITAYVAIVPSAS